MPRQGDGSSDNGPIEVGENLVHGTSGDTSLNRASKVAPAPEPEKGAAIEGLNASGGGSDGAHQNASNQPPAVDQATKN